jgi:light-regulated signal transduction histidine kinase (bacteriophytochrome)
VTLEKAKSQAAELSRSNAELAKFAYVASHDLQEPLRKVSSFCQLLQERYADQLDERAREYIHYAVDGAQRMQQLLLSVLEWSRIGSAPEPKDEVDCGDALQEALANLQSTIEESGAEVTCEDLPVIRGGRSRNVQLFQNLLSNAIKFRQGLSPRIHVGAQRTAEGWRFSVSDNGIGIAAEYQEQIFEVFQRLHTRDEYPGTGVGLAVCKRIVESRGGRIWVESRPGGGSTFIWTSPEEG